MSLLGRWRKQATKPAAEAEERPDGPRAGIRIDSRDYTLAALDSKQLTVDGFGGDLVAGQRFHFAFLLPLKDGTVEVPTQGTVLSLDGSRLVARYYAPQPYYQRLMRQAVDSLPMSQG